MIARDGSGEACTYSPQSTAAPKNKLHSTQHKKASKKLSYMLLAILSFVPSFFTLAAQHLPHQHALQLSLFALSIPATFAAVLLLSNYIPCLTRGNLAARLDEKLTAQGIQVNSWAGIYVGFSPAAAPRSYESNCFWDIGYLFFRSDRICYWGEEIQFSLRRDQITDIKLDTGLPGFLGSKRVYIAWRDDELGSCGVFNLGRGHADSVRSGSRQTKQLADRLQIWWKTPSLARPLTPNKNLADSIPRESNNTFFSRMVSEEGS